MRITAKLVLFSFYLLSLCACSVAGISHPSDPSEGPIPDAPFMDPVPEASGPDSSQTPVLVSEPIAVPDPEIEQPPPKEPPQSSYNPIGIIDETPTTPPAIIISPDDSSNIEVEPPVTSDESEQPESSEPPPPVAVPDSEIEQSPSWPLPAESSPSLPESLPFPADSSPSPGEDDSSEYELIPTPENIDNLIVDMNPELTDDYEDPNDYYIDDNRDPENIVVSGMCKGKDKVAVIVINTKNKKKKYQSVKCKKDKFLLRFSERQKNRRNIKIQIIYFD